MTDDIKRRAARAALAELPQDGVIGIGTGSTARLFIDALGELVDDFGARILRVPRRLDFVRRELDEYFEGRRREFDLQLDLSPVSGFNRDALRELSLVPYGQVTTYGALAAKVGHPKAARAVGGAMNRNPIPIVLPCHRVVGANGKLVGYAGGLDRKELLLKLEGAMLDTLFP